MATLHDVVEGIKVIAKYLPNGLQSMEIGASHDKIYVGHEDIKETISEEDFQLLKKFGWHFDNESYSFAKFV